MYSFSSLHTHLTNWSVCSSRCSFWPRSGRCGGNFHFNQLGETTGSHQRCATSAISATGDHMIFGFSKTFARSLYARLSCRLHALGGRWKHGAEPPWHGNVGDTERPFSREVVQHQHLRRGRHAGERAYLCTGPHRWRHTSRYKKDPDVKEDVRIFPLSSAFLPMNLWENTFRRKSFDKLLVYEIDLDVITRLLSAENTPAISN